MRPSRDDQELKCSFCGKSQSQIAKLISGPAVYVCNECINLCVDIMNDELSSLVATMPFDMLKISLEDFLKKHKLTTSCTLVQLNKVLRSEFKKIKVTATTERDEARAIANNYLREYFDLSKHTTLPTGHRFAALNENDWRRILVSELPAILINRIEVGGSFEEHLIIVGHKADIAKSAEKIVSSFKKLRHTTLCITAECDLKETLHRVYKLGTTSVVVKIPNEENQEG